MTRAEFLKGAAAGCVLAATDRVGAASRAPLAPCRDYASLQGEIDLVSNVEYRRYLQGGEVGFDALARLEDAFDKVLAEVRSTVVTGCPAVWFVYNMGVIVKTAKVCFSIDLMHRRALEFAPLLDFALITHNHGDHFTREFYEAMDRAGKTVINNFACNYGAADWKKGGADWAKKGGYTRAEKTFHIEDVEIRTGLSDHNGYLVDFTSTFEITVGDYRIYHSGDSANLDKLHPQPSPDLWIVHPVCGVKVDEGVRKFSPKTTVLAHLNELGHAKGGSRWTWQRGLSEMAKVEAVGGKAVVPLWGDRLDA